MADFPSPTRDPEEFNPWQVPPADFDDPWSSPDDVRARERRQIRRYQWGFTALGFGLIIASLFSVGSLLLIFFNRGVLGQLAAWDFVEETTVVLATVVGSGLLWGGSKDESWRRRSGLLLMMCLVDLVLWSIDHAPTLGLSDMTIGHEPFRRALGHALGWSEFALIASLAAGMAASLGEPRALDLGRAVRSLTTVGAAVWFAYFFLRTDWSPPIWPLRERPLNLELLYLWIGSAFLSTAVLVQVTMICLYAGRTCARAGRALRAQEQASEAFPSRSEAGWDDLTRRDRDR